MSDLKKAQDEGIDEYDREQEEKVRILNYLLSNYNDGRRKNFYCVAVNLMELSEIREALDRIKENVQPDLLSEKEKCQYAADVFKEIAGRRNLELKLHKKK